jgi:hypothetical protein
MVETGHTPDETGEIRCPDSTGGTNFWPQTFDPSTRTFFVNVREACMTFYVWKQMGANLHGTSAITYMVDGRQHLLVPAGTTLTAWALPQ